MRTTLQHIANSANVSLSTASRVLNKRGSAYISEETVQRVLKVANEMGYRPNQAARAMATGRTNMISLWTANVCPMFYAYTIHCLRRSVREYGYELQIVETENHMNSEHSVPNSLSWPVDGIILFQNPWYVEEYVNTISALSVPVVGMGSCTLDMFDNVKIEQKPASIKAVKHFISSGRQRIAMMVEATCPENNDCRYQAYQEVMQDAGYEQEIITYRCTDRVFERDQARRTFSEYLESNICPDAVFCYNDESAIGVYRALRDLGIRIPDDVALIGCDGITDTMYLDPPLSSIVPPTEKMCNVASRFLHKRINDPDVDPQQIILEAELVLKGSC